MNAQSRSQDIAGEQYWSNSWGSEYDRTPVDERDAGWRNYVTRRFDRLFSANIPQGADRNVVLLEVGCARSRWLPYFARRFGISVKGLDYSKIGCQQAEDILRSSGTTGEIFHGDLFSPPPELLARADVVFSWGLAEHFQDTHTVAQALRRFSKPGSIVITVIPNMVGSVGWLQRFFDEKTYRLHVPLNPAQLCNAFATSESEVLFCDYFLACNYWVVHRGAVPESRVARALHALLYKALAGLTMLVWRFEDLSRIKLPATRMFSPYVVCLSRAK